MSRARLAFVTGAVAAALPLLGGQPPGRVNQGPGQTRNTIHIRNFAFVPAELHVAAGDTVWWVNDDGFNHTTAADSAAWTSPELHPGDQFLVVASPGRFPYHCAAHPVMRGMLVVE